VCLRARSRTSSALPTGYGLFAVPLPPVPTSLALDSIGVLAMGTGSRSRRRNADARQMRPSCGPFVRVVKSQNVATRLPPKHGTTAGYRKYGCRCDACRKAVVDCQRTWRQGLTAEPVTSHGVYGYNIRRCRCSVCCAAKAAYRAAGKARRVSAGA